MFYIVFMLVLLALIARAGALDFRSSTSPGDSEKMKTKGFNHPPERIDIQESAP